MSKKRKYKLLKRLNKTRQGLTYLWIALLFLSPFLGFFSILILSYFEIASSIDWNADFFGN